MAIAVGTVWEVRGTGNAANAGGFNVGNANFPTDLTATSGTGSSPAVSSASYSFVSGDVGASVFVRSGTNWVPGFYLIASVSGGAATLSAAIGAVSLYGGASNLNTAAGCATTASPTGGTWGVDYSQQASAQFSFTDMVIDGTTNTKFTSAAFPVGKNFIGNLINVTSGTGFTAQRVEIVSTVTTTATCDKSLGTLSSTGGIGKLGGCFDTIAHLMAAGSVSGNKYYATGSYTNTATTTCSTGSWDPGYSQPPTSLIGYGSVRGDGGKCTITLATNTGLTGLVVNTNGWIIENFTIDCAGLGTSTAISLTSTLTTLRNCIVKNFTVAGIYLGSSYALVSACEVTAGTSAATAGVILASSDTLEYCDIHDNACSGVSGSGAVSSSVRGCLVTNNSGASSDGIAVLYGTSVVGNTVYGSGRHGIYVNTNVCAYDSIKNNILAGNGGYGLKLQTAAGYRADFNHDGNAYYNNTSGTRNNADDVGAVNAINGVAPYINTLDVILSADPFAAKASSDFRLNATAGGGAAARGHGVPTSWPGNSLTTSFPDFGVSQHADPTGGSIRRPKLRQAGT
jgi:hypothetical protein